MKLEMLTVATVLTFASICGCQSTDVTVKADRADADYPCDIDVTDIRLWTLAGTNFCIEQVIGACCRDLGIEMLSESGTMDRDMNLSLAITDMPADQLLFKVLNDSGLGLVDWGGVHVIRTKEQIASAGDILVTAVSFQPHSRNVILDSMSIPYDCPMIDVIDQLARLVGLDIEVPTLDGRITFMDPPPPIPGPSAAALLRAVLRLRDLELSEVDGSVVIKKRRVDANQPSDRTR